MCRAARRDRPDQAPGGVEVDRAAFQRIRLLFSVYGLGIITCSVDYPVLLSPRQALHLCDLADAPCSLPKYLGAVGLSCLLWFGIVCYGGMEIFDCRKVRT